MKGSRRCAVVLIVLLASATSAFGQTRFSVEVRGSGPDVILIPGLASSRAVWDATAKQFEGRYRLHVVQIAGFAGEPAGPNATGDLLEPLANELAAYARGLRRPALVGHSLGGLLGLMVIARAGDAVDRLMVVDALPFYSVLFSPTATVDFVKPQAAAMRDATIAQTTDVFARSQALGVPRLVKTESERPRIVEWSVKSDRGVMARAVYEDMITDMRPRLAQITTPVTIVYAYDPIMGPQGMVENVYTSNYAALPNRKLTRVDGAYHFLMLDQPVAFASALETFLAR